MYQSPGYGNASWNGTANTVGVYTKAYYLGASTCDTTYFDWQYPSHHDARAVRACKNASGLYRLWSDASGVTAIQKFKLCRSGYSSLGFCVAWSQLSCGMTVSPAFPNHVTSAFVQWPNGSTSFYDSNPTSASS